MAGTLYTYPDNFRAYKALIAAQYSGAKVQVASDFVFGETNKQAAFLKKFPTGKVPAFETATGQTILESNAIAHYVANEQLRGTTDLARAQVLQWSHYADAELLPAAVGVVFPLLGILPYNKNNVERSRTDLNAVLAVLEQHLTAQTFFVGERITLADIVVFANLLSVFQHVLDAPARGQFVAVTRWFNTVLHQKQTAAVVKGFQLAAAAPAYDPKKYAEFQKRLGGGAAAAPAAEKPKADKPKADKPKKAAKEAEPAEELDDAELALLAEPKSKCPFDSLPKGTFNMDDFKRSYSNESEDVSIPYFWSKFDAENYSIWYGEYKYNDELTKVFMSCNLIAGMYQRLDKMRKQAFASVCLFGEDNNNTISGVWVWRGQELVFPLSPDWQIDYDCYDWKKLDPASDETKKLVKQYLSWEGTDKDGRKFNQGKIFK